MEITKQKIIELINQLPEEAAIKNYIIIFDIKIDGNEREMTSLSGNDNQIISLLAKAQYRLLKISDKKNTLSEIGEFEK